MSDELQRADALKSQSGYTRKEEDVGCSPRKTPLAAVGLGSSDGRCGIHQCVELVEHGLAGAGYKLASRSADLVAVCCIAPKDADCRQLDLRVHTQPVYHSGWVPTSTWAIINEWRSWSTSLDVYSSALVGIDEHRVKILVRSAASDALQQC